TRSNRSSSRKTLGGFTRSCTSTISLWTSGSLAASRVNAALNSKLRVRSGGRCPLVSGNEKSATAACAQGVSISPYAPAKKARRECRQGFGFLHLPAKKLLQQKHLLCSHAHALTIYGIEPAQRIANRQ